MISPFSSIENKIDGRFFTPIELKAGDAVVFDTRLMHRSLDNFAKEPRTGVSTVIAHTNAQLFHFIADDYSSETVKSLLVSNDFFTGFGINEPIAESYPFVEIPATKTQVSLMEFSDKYFNYSDSLSQEIPVFYF